eukprot:g27077.t1
MGGASAATSMGRLERGDTSELHGDPFSRSTTKRGSAGLFGDGAPVTMRTMDSWLSPSMEEVSHLGIRGWNPCAKEKQSTSGGSQTMDIKFNCICQKDYCCVCVCACAPCSHRDSF